MRRLTAVALTALCAFLELPAARAADHTNLEENLPLRVEDAYTLAYGARELQLGGRFQKLRNGQYVYELIPRFEYGFARNWQATVATSALAGPSDHTGSGDLEVELFRNLNTEGIKLPAFAVSGRLTFPSGVNSAGTDTRVKGIMTKTLGNSSYLHRVHVNGEYYHNAGRLRDERKDYYAVVLGYQARLSTSNQFVADVYREQQKMRGMDWNVAEVGVRHQATPQTVVALGVGAGFGPGAPRFRITLSVQHDLGGSFHGTRDRSLAVPPARP